MSDGLKQAVQRRGSFIQTMRAVAWFGGLIVFATIYAVGAA